jgi:hypothetical protein
MQLTAAQALKAAEAEGQFSWQQPCAGSAGQCASHHSHAQAGGATATSPKPSAQVPTASDAAPPADQGAGGSAGQQGIDVAAATAILAASHAAHEQPADAASPAAASCCAQAAPEPTEEELTGALAEATQLLDACVSDINEALEEVQCALADAADE